jgi:REP element-mobilizing transposase RayT
VHSIISNHLHVVFATAERRALIPDELKTRLWPYIGGVTKRVGAKALAVGGTSDHVHILLSVPGSLTTSEVIQKIKANSSRWISEEGRIPLFAWQRGYGAFSVGMSGVPGTIAYILGQAEHHRSRNFRAEWEQILRQHHIESAVASSRDFNEA